MKLQVAVDVTALDEALVLSRQVADQVDVIEVGTPLIKSEGLLAVRAVRAAHPDTTILADMKTTDAGELEAEMAFRAGADLVTVMAMADDDTVRGAVTAARRHGKAVVADMTAVQDPATRARELVRAGVAYCAIHADFDAPRHGGSVDAAIEMGRDPGVPFSVAGGVDVHSILDVWAAGAAVAVVGRAIHGAADPRAAACELRAAIEHLSVAWPAESHDRRGRPHGVPPGVGPGKAETGVPADRPNR